MNHRQRSSKDEPPQQVVTPLYDARYEHDACGVGFVADAGGRSRERVLPLALAGLAALGHRGAFGADGESSDGAGIALPLDRSVLELLAGDAAAGRPGVVSLFLPRGRAAEARARTFVETRSSPGRGWRSSRGGPCPSTRMRWVPPRPCRGPRSRRRSWLGRREPRERPAQTSAPSRMTPSSGGSSSRGAGWRPLPVRPAVLSARSPCPPRRRGPSSTRASSSAGGCPTCTRTCAPRSRSRMPSSTSAMRRTPVPCGGSPSRSARSRTTARSTRSAAIARRCVDAPPTPPRPRSHGRFSPPVRCCPTTAPIRCRSTRASSS